MTIAECQVIDSYTLKCLLSFRVNPESWLSKMCGFVFIFQKTSLKFYLNYFYFYEYQYW